MLCADQKKGHAYGVSYLRKQAQAENRGYGMRSQQETGARALSCAEMSNVQSGSEAERKYNREGGLRLPIEAHRSPYYDGE